MRTAMTMMTAVVLMSCGGTDALPSEPTCPPECIPTVPPVGGKYIGGLYEGTAVVDGHDCRVNLQLEMQPDETFHAVYGEASCDGVPTILPQALVGGPLVNGHELALSPALAEFHASLDLTWSYPDLDGWVTRTPGAPKSMVHVVRVGP